jgi:hypothetical protein
MNDEMNAAESPDLPPDERRFRAVLLRVLLETFDVYVRASAGIAAEGGLPDEVAVEALMNYCLALPDADDLIVGFLRGELTMFSVVEQTRAMVERDKHSLELEPAGAVARGTATDHLGKKLELMRRAEETARVAAGKGAKLEKFIRENPTTYQQVAASKHEFLVRWVMLHLMNETEARERGHRVAHEFWRQFPAIHDRLKVTVAMRSQPKPQLSGSKETSVRKIGATGIGAP